jgi:hypothetical protein
VHLSVRDAGDPVRGLASRARLRPGREQHRLPAALHATGVDKVLLAHAPGHVKQRVCATLTRITPYMVAQPDLVHASSIAVRDGYATTTEEISIGACSLRRRSSAPPRWSPRSASWCRRSRTGPSSSAPCRSRPEASGGRSDSPVVPSSGHPVHPAHLQQQRSVCYCLLSPAGCSRAAGAPFAPLTGPRHHRRAEAPVNNGSDHRWPGAPAYRAPEPVRCWSTASGREISVRKPCPANSSIGRPGR